MITQTLTIPELANEFFLQIQLANWTESSIKTCQWHIERFIKFLSSKSITDPEYLTKDVLREYQLDLVLSDNARGKRFSATTINRYMASISTFLKFLKDADYFVTPTDPEKGIIFAKKPRTLPREILSRDEMTALIESPDIKTVLGYRDRTIMELLYTTAIRRNECRSLKIQNINYQDCLLRVFGKGQKERMAPIGRIALKFLDGYVSNVRHHLLLDPAEDHLFLSSRGRPFAQNTMGVFITKYAKQIGIDKRVTPHTFRHTCATLMLRNRADIRHIQMLLGHESIESTQIYTHVAAVDLKLILEKYHPRERQSDA